MALTFVLSLVDESVVKVQITFLGQCCVFCKHTQFYDGQASLKINLL